MVTIVAPPPASGIRVHGLSPGDRAPELDLPATPDGRRLVLADLLPAPVVLIFYPGDFTPVCTSELGLFSELLPELGSFGARVLAISCDSFWSHAAYATELKMQLPLLSDFHPKGACARRYNVYRDEDGISERALFVLDGQGTVFWSYVSPIEANPGADGVLDALERLSGRALQPPPPHAPQPPEVRP